MPYKRKLTEEQVQQIIDERAKGTAYNTIAEQFGVSGSRIYEITNPEKQAEKREKMKAWRKANKPANKQRAAREDGMSDDEMEQLELEPEPEDAEDEATEQAEYEDDLDGNDDIDLTEMNEEEDEGQELEVA